MKKHYIISIQPWGREINDDPRTFKVGKQAYIVTIENGSNVGNKPQVFTSAVAFAKVIVESGLFDVKETLTMTISNR
jgi:hypothetical protein